MFIPGLIQVSQLVKHFKHITHQSHDHTRQRLLLNTKTRAECELMEACVYLCMKSTVMSVLVPAPVRRLS